MSNCFNPANILLPNDCIDMEKWSVIACDQFTSQADYWDAVEKHVADAPSTLNVVFPEIYLGTITKQENDCNSSGDGVKNDKETGRKTKYASMTDDERIKYINTTMETYLTDGTLKQAVADGYVLVERTTESGVRLGIVGLIDLDDYDFDPKKKTLIRATEGTVISRIPSRVKIRENAAIELPHVMLLVDDPIDRQKIDGCQGATQEDAVNIAAVKHGIIEYVYAIRDTLRKLYDTELMQGGGHIRGYAVEGEAAKQGINILINIFYNVAVNAAVGVANQVRNAVFGFITSFQTAFNPQIVKLYAAKDTEQLLALIYRSSKFSYYLLFIISFPILLFCKEILSIWLVNVPDYAVVFTQLVIIASFTEALSAPLWTAIGATGKVQKYQILVSLIVFLDVPLVYVAFKLGMHPTTAFVITLIIGVLAYLYRLFYIRKFVPYHISQYIKKVVLPCCVVTVLSIPVPYILYGYGTSTINTILLAIGTTAISTVITLFIGLDKSEKKFVKSIFNKMLKKIS